MDKDEKLHLNSPTISSLAGDAANINSQTKIDKKEIEEFGEVVPPVDTGYAWIIMLGAFINVLFVFGSFNAFGAFQEYYLNEMFVNESATNISWIGTISYTVVLSGGLFAGPIASYIGIRYTCLLGTVVGAIGLLLASFSKTIITLTITQGFIYSLGGSLVLNCSLLAPSLWFDKRKSIAFGIILSGGGFGSLILVPIFNSTVSSLGISCRFSTQTKNIL
ncbi:hypothetical protein BB559_004160 [Furculomyces boomerangus]|uniref:Major facilitator superfamily (MFS) profile domain-containing protein n=2 Tax=Harpellales TaxID=61421 RepID=A0A2T9YGE1_9FUNG|nr:hypothetical protein BB559_004160 [Furculomyces boomerangus]PWA00099.1 hypothetical protein BB558_003864 [Smittium angustum]